jgi:hypothetical protein
MTAESFVYWLKGFFELAQPTQMRPDQMTVVREHLNLVFTKVTKAPATLTQPTSPYLYPATGVALTCGINPKTLC